MWFYLIIYKFHSFKFYLVGSVRMIKIMIAMNREKQIVKMKNLLVEEGYNVIYVARDGQECLRKARILQPDLAIIDFDLPVYNGYEVAKILIEDKICSVLLIASDTQTTLIGECQDQWDFAYLVKPINKSTLITAVQLITKTRKKVKELEKENKNLRDSLESRKLIEKAKGILMKELGIPEQDAYRIIQKRSMDKRIPMKEIAKAVILTYED